jgi:hypothetical protein
MGQTHTELTENLAARWCWEGACRDEVRIARRLYRKEVVDGVYRLDEGALWDDVFHVRRGIGVMALREPVHGTAIQRERRPDVQDILLYGLKTLFGMKRMKALPALWCSDEALMPWVGFHAQQVRHGVCPRGAATRPGAREPGPLGPETLAQPIVRLNLRELESVLKGAIRALARAGVCEAQVTGIVDGTDLATTAHSTGCGQVTRQRRLEETRGQAHEIEVTVDGWNVWRLIAAVPKIPRAGKVGKIQEHATHWTRALVTPARAHLAGHTRRHKVVFDQGLWDGTDLWWLDQHGLRLVVPAKTTMTVTGDARAQATAGEGMTVGRRVHTGRHGQGHTASTARLATEVVGMTGLTTDDQDGPPEHGRQHHRRDFQPHPINAVVVRQWPGRDDGPGGHTVFLTHASVAKPLQPCADDDDRRLIEPGCITETQQPGDLGQPPQNSERAVRVHVMFTLRLFALATAYRLPCAREALGGEAVGWPRWRRQIREQTRDQVIVCAQGYDGLFHLAEYSLLLGVKLKHVPPEVGSPQQVLAKFKLPAGGELLCRNFRR